VVPQFEVVVRRTHHLEEAPPEVGHTPLALAVLVDPTCSCPCQYVLGVSDE
jgi:hypothetical protein